MISELGHRKVREQMQIVIDIPDKVYGIIKYFEPALDSEYKEEDDVKTILIKGILNGTPLPKGHGRIVDGDEILIWMINKGIIDKLKCGEVASVFERATIIQADKEKEE